MNRDQNRVHELNGFCSQTSRKFKITSYVSDAHDPDNVYMTMSYSDGSNWETVNELQYSVDGGSNYTSMGNAHSPDSGYRLLPKSVVENHTILFKSPSL